jgi:hypothetical protein
MVWCKQGWREHHGGWWQVGTTIVLKAVEICCEIAFENSKSEVATS